MFNIPPIRIPIFFTVILCLLYGTTNIAQASENLTSSIQTKTLEPKVGAKESTLGAQVVRVDNDNDNDNDGVRIEISLPKKQAERYIEQIQVYGTAVPNEFNLPSGSAEISQTKPFEIIQDIKQGRYGLILHLKKAQNFTLNFNYRNLSQEKAQGFAPLNLMDSDKNRNN